MGIFEYRGVKIEWIGHASFKISDKLVIYFDPYVLPKTPEKADLVFVTHEHYDHCDVENIKKILKEDGVVVATEDCLEKLGDLETFVVTPEKKFEVKGVKFETIPAYNLKKTFHPRSKNWVGYVIELYGTRIYHAGDTDYVPEMYKLKDIDVALLPVGGTYTMNYKEAAEAVNSFKPKVAIPMHYGKIVGTKKDAERFKELVEKGIEVVILDGSGGI